MDRLMDKLPLLAILAVAALVLLITELRAQKRERQPVYTERAKLIEKQISVDQIGGRLYSGNRHIDELIFETDRGEIVKVRTAWSTSRKIPVGAEGILTWQGTKLENFVLPEKE